MNTIRYIFPGCRLIHHKITGMTTTLYSDGGYSECPVVKDDYSHAHILGITPQQHRLEHELWHHIIGVIIYHADSSLIIYRDSHGLKHLEKTINWHDTWHAEEWLVTAMTYAMHNNTSQDHGASHYLREEKKVNVNILLDLGKLMCLGALRILNHSVPFWKGQIYIYNESEN